MILIYISENAYNCNKNNFNGNRIKEKQKGLLLEFTLRNELPPESSNLIQIQRASNFRQCPYSFR